MLRAECAAELAPGTGNATTGLKGSGFQRMVSFFILGLRGLKIVLVLGC